MNAILNTGDEDTTDVCLQRQQLLEVNEGECESMFAAIDVQIGHLNAEDLDETKTRQSASVAKQQGANNFQSS